MASSSLTSSMILFLSWAKMRLWSMFIVSTRLVFILRAKKFDLKSIIEIVEFWI